MTPRLLLEPAAESEFLEAAAWYAERSPRLEAVFRRSVAATFGTIEEAPQRFPIALRDIRKARVARFPYVVYYVPLPEVIVVIAIIHGRRDPRRWQNRR
jgi:plasmid stabilization system protein ParE